MQHTVKNLSKTVVVAKGNKLLAKYKITLGNLNTDVQDIDYINEAKTILKEDKLVTKKLIDTLQFSLIN